MKNDADKVLFGQLFAKKGGDGGQAQAAPVGGAFEGCPGEPDHPQGPTYKPSAKDGWGQSQEWVAQHLVKQYQTFFQAVSLGAPESMEGSEG